MGRKKSNVLSIWEQRILGLLLLEPYIQFPLLKTVSSDDFHFPEHKIVFKTMRDLYDSGEPIDLITLMERLKDNGNLERVGGAVYLCELYCSLEDRPKKRKKAEYPQHVNKKGAVQWQDS